MKKRDLYLWIGNILMLLGAVGIPALANYGYIASKPFMIFLSSGALLASFVLWFMGIITEPEPTAEPAKS